MNPILERCKRDTDALSDPTLLLTPDETRRAAMLRLVAQLREKVRFTEAPDMVFWGSPVMTPDGDSVAFKTSFGGQTDSLRVRMNAMGEPSAVEGRGVDPTSLDPAFEDSPFAMSAPSPFRDPKRGR